MGSILMGRSATDQRPIEVDHWSTSNQSQPAGRATAHQPESSCYHRNPYLSELIMPNSLDRFLHTYSFKLVKWSSSIGGIVAPASWAAYVTASAAAAAAAAAAATAATAAAGAAAAARAAHLSLVAQVAFFAGTGGVAFVVIPFLYGVARATFWRKKRKSFSENENAWLSDHDFLNQMDWDCFWTTCTVIGYERTGKTLLKERLRGFGQPGPASTSTRDREIHLICLDPIRKAYMALLDAKGSDVEKSAHQDDLIEIAMHKARVVILVLDHADTERYGNNAPLDNARLDIQRAFIREHVVPRFKGATRRSSILSGRSW